MIQRAEINEREALRLWENGWCWEALGDRYSCTGLTVKSRFSHAVREHSLKKRASHRKCPFCYPEYKDQMILI